MKISFSAKVGKINHLGYDIDSLTVCINWSYFVNCNIENVELSPRHYKSQLLTPRCNGLLGAIFIGIYICILNNKLKKVDFPFFTQKIIGMITCSPNIT